MINYSQGFLALVRAGLWVDSSVHDSWFRVYGSEQVNWEEMNRLAEEQSVIGVVLAGIDWFKVQNSSTSEAARPSAGFTVPQELLLQWIGDVQLLEQQNKAMNGFIGELFGKLSKAGINALLVKGQGVAQSYEKPHWRCCGDIDLLMDGENYERAKNILIPVADHVETEDVGKKHLGLYIKDFLIELHGAMPFGLSKKANQVVEEVIGDSLERKSVCTWMINKTEVYLPNLDNHIFLVFTHFLQHFFIEGVGLRQICDWCRMLWKYRTEIDVALLERRLRSAGLMSEWKVFASLAVETLGMPVEAMPFLEIRGKTEDGRSEIDRRWKRKGEKVLKRVLRSGNFGHNNDLSYRTRYSGVTYNVVAMWRRFWDFASLIPIFPMDAPRFFVMYVIGKV